MKFSIRFLLPAALIVASAALLPSSAENLKVAPLSWLHERGMISTNEAIEAVGVKVSDAQRAEIEKAVAQRNQELQEVNARFSATLSKTLGKNDEELAKQVAEEKERRRMKLIKSRQPGRYQGMKK